MKQCRASSQSKQEGIQMSTKQKTILQSGVVIAVILVLFIVLVNALNGPNRDEAVIDSRSSETSSESVVSSDESGSSSSSLLSMDESSSESVSRPPTQAELESQRQAEESDRKAVEESQRIEESNRVQASIDESIRIEQRVNESLAAIEQERKESEAAEQARNEYAESVRQRELAKIEEERKQKQAEQESLKQESIRQESIAEESRRLESEYQESIKQESIKQESIKQESIKQESIKQESIKQESIRQESLEAERQSIEESIQESVQESIRIEESNKQASISESIRLEEESKDETTEPEPTPEPEVTPEPSEPLPEAPEGLETLASAFKWLKGYKDGYILFSIVDMGETEEEHVKTVDTHVGIYEQGVHVSGLNQNVYIIGDTTYYDLNKELDVINNEELTSVYQDKYGIKVSDEETGITDEKYRELVTSIFTQLEEFVVQLDGSRVYRTESGLSELELTDDEVTQINELYAELFSVMGSEHTLPVLEGAKYYLNVSDTGLIGSRVVDAEGIEQYKLAIGSERREWPGFNVDEVTTVDYTEFESEVEAIQPEEG